MSEEIEALEEESQVAASQAEYGIGMDAAYRETRIYDLMPKHKVNKRE